MLAETGNRLDHLENANWQKKSVMVDTLGRENRKTLGMLRDEAVKGAGQAVRDFSGLQRDVAKAEVEGQGQRRMAREKENFDQKKWLATETSDLRAEIAAIDDIEKAYPEDIPGVHALSRFTPDIVTRQFQDNRNAREMLYRPIVIRLRRESGAGVPDAEIEREARAIVEAMTEEDVRGDLARRKQEAMRRMDYITRATTQDIEGQYLNRPVGERGALTRGVGGQGPSSLVLDE
jgi:hypothetical protein